MKKDATVEARMTIGDRIREIRGDMPVDEFANLLKVHKNTVVRYEKSQRTPDVEFLLKLRTEFGVTPNWVLIGIADVAPAIGPMHRDQQSPSPPPDEVPATPKSQDQVLQVELNSDEELDVADQWGLEEAEILALFEEFWAGLPVDLKELVAEEVLGFSDLFARWVKKRIRRGNPNATQSKAVNE